MHEDLLETIETALDSFEQLQNLDLIFDLIEQQFPDDLPEPWMKIAYWMVSQCRTEIDMYVSRNLVPLDRLLSTYTNKVDLSSQSPPLPSCQR